METLTLNTFRDRALAPAVRTAVAILLPYLIAAITTESWTGWLPVALAAAGGFLSAVQNGLGVLVASGSGWRLLAQRAGLTFAQTALVTLTAAGVDLLDSGVWDTAARAAAAATVTLVINATVLRGGSAIVDADGNPATLDDVTVPSEFSAADTFRRDSRD